jgi:hypothetical protein
MEKPLEEQVDYVLPLLELLAMEGLHYLLHLA